MQVAFGFRSRTSQDFPVSEKVNLPLFSFLLGREFDSSALNAAHKGHVGRSRLTGLKSG